MAAERKGFLYRLFNAPSVADSQSAPSDVQTRSELPVAGNPGYPISAQTLQSIAGDEITWDRAVGLVGVYRATNIIATGVSQLPVGVWKDNEEVPQRSTSLIVAPHADMSRRQFLRETVTSLALTGNAYWLLTQGNDLSGNAVPITRPNSKTKPDVKNLVVLNPNAIYIEVVTDAQGNERKVYKYGKRTYEFWQVKHLMLDILPGFPRGTGPIQAAQNEIRGALDLRNYADQWFANGDIPSGVLKTDQVLTPEDADGYATRWADVGTARGRTVRVLGQGLSYQPVYLSPEDAQFIQSQEFSAKQIALMFGVPAIYMLVDPGNSMTYNNAEQVDAAFVKYTLMSYAGPIEDALTDLIPRGQEARFVFDELLRTDTKTRYEAYAAADWMTVNEKRQREGLPPVPGGDIFTPKTPNTNNQGETNGTTGV